AALTLALAGAAAAQDQPRGPAPQIAMANVGKDGRLYIPRIVHEAVPVTYQVKTIVNGREETQTRTVTQMVPKQVSLYLDDPKVQVTTTDGKRVDVKGLKLQGPTAVLVSTDGRPVDAAYTRLAREGTLVIIAPPSGEAIAPPRPDSPPKLPAPK